MIRYVPEAIELEFTACLFKSISKKLGNDSTEAFMCGLLLGIIAQNAAHSAYSKGYCER